MRIAICDDDRQDACAVCELLGGQEVKWYDNAGSMLADVKQKGMRYDLYLLDIFMGDSMNGLELARELRGIDEDAVLCFVSTSSDFYRDAYDLYALQYLIKPVKADDLQRLLDKVEKTSSTRGEKMVQYSWRREQGVIPYGKILYISSMKHVLSIWCTDGSVQESVGKLDDLERQICGDAFLRCHQSFIVNMNHVRAFSGAELTLAKDGQKVPVSRRYRTEVKTRFEELLFEGVE